MGTALSPAASPVPSCPNPAPPGAVPLQWERVRALVSRCTAMAWKMPGKLQSCLQEQEEAQQRADESLRAKEEVTGLCGAWRVLPGRVGGFYGYRGMEMAQFGLGAVLEEQG